jgi:hypothetical protein
MNTELEKAARCATFFGVRWVWNFHRNCALTAAHSMRMQEGIMNFRIMTLALAATAFSSLGAYAQTTIIEERRPGVIVEERRVAPPPVVIEQRQTPVVVEPAPSTSVTTHERGGFLGTESRTTTTTTGTGPTGDCATRTTHREDLLGEKTVSRVDCP